MKKKILLIFPPTTYQEGLIQKDEFNVPADKDRGLSRFSKKELDQICLKAFRDFYRRPSLWIGYLRKIIRIREPWALQLLSGMSSRFFKDFLR